MPRPTVRVVIIGDEVLTGKVADANSPFLLRRLRQLGARCDSVRVVPDDVARIAEAVREDSAAADFVITTGGVGPTHDDVTIAGIGAAFGLPIREDATLLAFLERHLGPPLDEAQRRLARVPDGAALTAGDGYPALRVGNVFVFPGVPSLLRQKFASVEATFVGDRPSCVALRTDLRETELAPLLEATLEAHPAVSIGSYPRRDAEGFRVLLTFEGEGADAPRAALLHLQLALPAGSPLQVLDPFVPEDAGGLGE